MPGASCRVPAASCECRLLWDRRLAGRAGAPARSTLHLALAGLGVPREELPALARQSLVLPDYKNHPKVVDLDEVGAILAEAFGG